jgi:lysylphosphatidylglycerol synthetase-like protein (DUF2156 family)
VTARSSARKSVSAQKLSESSLAPSAFAQSAVSTIRNSVRPFGVSRRVLRRALLSADNVFQLERLHSFSRKFHPDWRPRYLCVEKLGDLPLVGLAYLRVEQLLTPPSRWRKRVPVSHL